MNQGAFEAEQAFPSVSASSNSSGSSDGNNSSNEGSDEGLTNPSNLAHASPSQKTIGARTLSSLSSSSFSQGSGPKEPTFPMKLHMILSNPEYQNIVCWLPHGRSWRILCQKSFEEQVIPQYFRHGRYSSFARQVNGWGFRRVAHGSGPSSYYHDMFLRGMPNLCVTKMKRLTAKDAQKQKDKDKPVPDFYALSREQPLPQAPSMAQPSSEGLTASNEYQANAPAVDSEYTMLEQRRATIMDRINQLMTANPSGPSVQQQPQPPVSQLAPAPAPTDISSLLSSLVQAHTGQPSMPPAPTAASATVAALQQPDANVKAILMQLGLKALLEMCQGRAPAPAVSPVPAPPPPPVVAAAAPPQGAAYQQALLQMLALQQQQQGPAQPPPPQPPTPVVATPPANLLGALQAQLPQNTDNAAQAAALAQLLQSRGITTAPNPAQQQQQQQQQAAPPPVAAATAPLPPPQAAPSTAPVSSIDTKSNASETTSSSSSVGSNNSTTALGAQLRQLAQMLQQQQQGDGGHPSNSIL